MNIEKCFALKVNGRCSALTNKDDGCKTGNCPFYKPKSVQAVQAEAAKQRCKKLGIKYGVSLLRD